MDLVARVHRTILQRDLLKKGEDVLVGVSGGVDSMTLLEVLRRIGKWRLHVAHFNHCLRGAESDADEEFVRKAAEQLGSRFISERGDVNARAAEQGISIEMAARELRHKFFVESAERIGVSKIALAHHADDQVETFWLRLLRGNTGPGLAGMRWKRKANASGTIQIARPLLDVPKRELLAFAQENGIAFREDSSNISVEFLRNRLRQEIIPKLEEFQPRLQQISWRAAEVLADEKDFLEKTARNWLQKQTPTFGELHSALQREIIRVQLVDAGGKPSFELIERLREAAGVLVSIDSQTAAIRESSGRIEIRAHEVISFLESSAKLDLSTEGKISVEDSDFQWRLVSERGESGAGVEFFDADAIGPAGEIRFWRPGDRFQPIGMSSAVKIQDLLTNAKIPAKEKRRRLVALDSQGKIFWVEGLRISELHKVTGQTRGVLRWEWRRK